jgi:hypothetical protein
LPSAKTAFMISRSRRESRSADFPLRCDMCRILDATIVACQALFSAAGVFGISGLSRARKSDPAEWPAGGCGAENGSGRRIIAAGGFPSFLRRQLSTEHGYQEEAKEERARQARETALRS